MRSLTITSALLAFLISLATASDGGGLSNQTMEAQLREKLSPPLREWVTLEAVKLRRSPSPEEAAVRTDIQARFQGQSLSAADQNRLAYLVFYEAYQAADRDLNNYMAQLKAASGAVKPPPAPATNPILQVGPNGAMLQPMPDRTGRIVMQPGSPREGSTSLGLGGVTMAPSNPRTARESPPGALTVSPAQAVQLQSMSNQRNQLVLVLNSLGKTVAHAPDSLLQQLK